MNRIQTLYLGLNATNCYKVMKHHWAVQRWGLVSHASYFPFNPQLFPPWPSLICRIFAPFMLLMFSLSSRFFFSLHRSFLLLRVSFIYHVLPQRQHKKRKSLQQVLISKWLKLSFMSFTKKEYFTKPRLVTAIREAGKTNKQTNIN